MPALCQFGICEKSYEWYGAHKEGVGAECSGHVAAEQGMNGPLTPASGTIETGEEMHGAFRHPYGFGRVNQGIDNGKGRQRPCRYQYQ